MECELDSPCPENSQCEGSKVDNFVSDLWIDFNIVKTALLAVICYFLYRLSQVLIRWPISFLFSLTGLSFLWNLLSHLVYAARGLLIVLRWSTYLWSFFVVLLSLFSKISWVPDAFKAVAGSLTNMKHHCEVMTKIPQHIKGFSKASACIAEHSHISTLRPHFRDTGLRLILLGPSRGACGSLRNSLLGISSGPLAHDTESTTWRAKVDGREVTVVETPDLLGSTLGVAQRAQQVLRSLQLASPGPHAFLLGLPTTYLDQAGQISARDILSTFLNLVGEEAANYMLLVFISLGPQGTSTLVQLLEEDYIGIKAALPLCGKRVALVNISPGRSIDSRTVESRRLLDMVLDMRAQQGHYLHQFLQKEDQVRKELLNHMAGLLAQKLEGISKQLGDGKSEDSVFH